MKKQILAEEVDQIIQQSFWGKGGVRLTESAEAPVAEAPAQEEEQVVEEAAEAHSCPLCESKLEQPISDEKLAEHVNFMVDVINEMENLTEEDLLEASEDEEKDEEEEEDGEDYEGA